MAPPKIGVRLSERYVLSEASLTLLRTHLYFTQRYITVETVALEWSGMIWPVNYYHHVLTYFSHVEVVLI